MAEQKYIHWKFINTLLVTQCESQNQILTIKTV